MPSLIRKPFTESRASNAATSLRATAIQTGSIAPGLAMPLPGRRWKPMDEQRKQQLLRYRMAMSMAKEMLRRGLISEEEYGIIDTIMTKRHLETSSTIFH